MNDHDWSDIGDYVVIAVCRIALVLYFAGAIQ